MVNNIQRRRRGCIQKLVHRYSLRKKHLRGGMTHRILGEKIFNRALWKPERESLIRGVTLGLFIGLLPIYGFQILLVIPVAVYVRANIPAGALITFISNPFSATALIVMQFKLGEWITSIWISRSMLPDRLPAPLYYGITLFIGCIFSATTMSLVFFICAKTLMKVYDSHLLQKWRAR